MRLRLTTLPIFILGLTATAFGQQAKIEGYVSDGEGRRVPFVRIVVTPGGRAGTTDGKGHFVISLPENIQPGQAARIKVEKANWVIFNPMFGKCETKSVARNFEPLAVVIVPKGSLLALSPKRISEVIAKWSNERNRLGRDINKLQNKVDDLKGELDEYAFLRKYAEEYGFTLDNFIAAANRWAQSKGADNDEERALQEYWRRNYTQAAQLADKSAQAAVGELLQSNKDTREASLKVIRRYRIKGNAYHAADKFGEALNAYDEIRKLVAAGELSKDKFAAEWAEISYFIGIAKTRLGERAIGKESQRLLNEAIVEFQQVMTFHTREYSPQDWGFAQTSLATTLLLLSKRAAGRESIKYLNDAIKAYNSVLEVRTRERSLEDWALPQLSLGNALSELGEQVDGPEGIKYLNDAVKAYNSVLEVTANHERLLWLWAVTQINLGSALSTLGGRTDGPDGIRHLNDAIEAFNLALGVSTRERSSYDWAAIHLNLGNALLRLSVRVDEADRVKYLKDAVEAYRDALEVYTHAQSPQDWSLTQSNLGQALSRLGEQIDGAEGVRHLNDAVVAYRAVLEVRSHEESPEDWVTIQIKLAGTLSKLGVRVDRAERIKYLEDAVKAYRNALEAGIVEQSPEERAATYLHFGNTLSRLGVQVSGTESIRHLKDAVEAYNSALEIIGGREQLPRLWSLTQDNLGTTLTSLGERVSGADGSRYLNDAVKAYRAALEVRTLEHSRYEWAATQNSLGNASLMLSVRVNEPDSTRFLNDAVVAYRAALEVRTREQSPELWAIIKKNLARTYVRLHDWSGAAESYADFLTLYPNDEEAYTKAVSLNHDTLFKFGASFLLTQRWLAEHPEDISAQASFAEEHFTVGRFGECEQRIDILLKKPKVPVSIRTALRAIEIASLLTADKTAQVPTKLDALITEVSEQPADFKVTRVFDGTRHFIGQNEKLSSHRAWLGRLFDALASGDRDKMLKALVAVRATFKR